MKKHLLISVLASSLLLVSLSGAQPVNAATNTLRRTSYVYTSKGKRVRRLKLAKYTTVHTYGTKRIKHRTFIRIGKNKYVLLNNLQKKRGLKDAKKYKVQLVKKPVLNIDNGQIPRANSVIANVNSLPTGTQITWSKKPDLNPAHDTAGEGIIKVTYPDTSSVKRHISFKLYGTDHIKLPTDYVRKY